MLFGLSDKTQLVGPSDWNPSVLLVLQWLGSLENDSFVVRLLLYD